MAVWMGLGIGLVVLLSGSRAWAQRRPADTPAPTADMPGEPPPKPDAMGTSNRVRRASTPSELVLFGVDALLLVPREILQLMIVLTSETNNLIENERVVPRVKSVLFSDDGEIGVFPTAFVETGFNPNIGARMIAGIGRFASTLRVGFGGVNRNLAEGRIFYLFPGKHPLFLGLEGYYERNTEVGYLGMGPKPETDPRNHFQPGLQGQGALYSQTRVRLLGSASVRLGDDFELLNSLSHQIRYVEDSPDAGMNAINRVFVPGSVPGSNETSRRVYGEVALRFDNRESRTAPVPGTLIETYSGLSQSVDHHGNQYLATGVRAAGFINVYRRTNILSPRIGLDMVAPLGGKIDFFELRNEPDFRGIDPRVDRTAAIASLDYRWGLSKAIAARFFTDATTVAPKIQALRPNQAVLAFGLGLDLFTPNTEIGRLAVSFDTHASVRVFLSFGISARGFGDRQHR